LTVEILTLFLIIFAQVAGDDRRTFPTLPGHDEEIIYSKFPVPQEEESEMKRQRR